MTRRTFLTLLLLGVTVAGSSAQVPAERAARVAELEAAIAVAGDGAAPQPLLELGKLVWGDDPARALELGRAALERLDDVAEPALAADAHDLVARCLLRLERREEALQHLAPARALYEQLGNRTKVAKCLGYQGIALANLGRLWPAIEATDSALAQFRELGDERGIAAASTNLGIYLAQAGEYQRALELNLEGLERERGLGHDIGIANSLNSVGNIYARLEEPAKARPYYQQALKIYQRLGESFGTAQALTNLGTTYEDLDQDDEAMRYYRRALAVGEADGATDAITTPLVNIGIVLKKQGRYAEALASYRRAAELERGIGDQSSLAVSLQDIGEVLLLMGQLDGAEARLQESQALSLQQQSSDILDTTYLNLAEVAVARGNYRQAYERLQRSGEARQARLDADKARTIAELEARYDAAHRREEIELLRKDNELLRKDGEIRRLELSRARLAAVLLALAIALILAGVILLARRYRSLLAFWRRRSFVGPYRLADRIAEGGMGIVYRAVSVVEPSRTVALKVIREEIAADPVQRQRFLNEGAIVDGLDHPNIVTVYERGEHNQQLYIAMELLEGRTLAAVIADAVRRQHTIPETSCRALMRQLADAVHTIHARGIVHRDITPSNIVVASDRDPEPVAKLLDFGVARADTVTTLTEAGEILGTVSYLAPERVRHQPPTPASDIFSLGAVFYELLTLERPFMGDDPVTLVRALLERTPLRPESLRPDLGSDLATLVMAMLAKDPAHRPCGEELLHRLRRLDIPVAAP